MAAAGERIAVWDAPVRLFHWSLAALVLFSFTTGRIGGGWMEWHLKSGYAILALLLFRIAWGVAGGQSARFASFLRGPRAALAYARATLAREHPTVVGHNPLGGWMVVAMLAILLSQAGSGLFADDEIATQGPLAIKVSSALVSRMSAWHTFNQWLVVGAVALHVVAIAIYQWGLRGDLIGPMIHGHAVFPAPVIAPRRGSYLLAAILWAFACGLVYWLVAVYPRTPA